MKNGLQKFGKFLSSMVMPNIGAFIAWGFITALFIPDGWLPNEQLASIQPYMLTYLLPILIAYTGGKIVGGDRGGVIGAIAVVGCIAGVGGTDGQHLHGYGHCHSPWNLPGQGNGKENSHHHASVPGWRGFRR